MTGDGAGRRWKPLPLALLIASTIVWAGCAAAFLLLQARDALDICDARGGSNNVGESRLQGWPPGRECTYGPEMLPPVDLDTGKSLPLVVPVSPYAGLSLIAVATFPVAVLSALSLHPARGR